MTSKSDTDYSKTLFLPKTDFSMRAGLPKLEPQIIEKWQGDGLYQKLRDLSHGRPKFILHDGPPYANGNIHIGHALNKILKDIIVRSAQMTGWDANYVPGWDCHGLPIEWKVEEEFRASNRNKDDVPINAFRAKCREFAARWIDVQREEFQRLGVIGDWHRPYITMDFKSEALIARELMKFAHSGQLYRSSVPIMWSVVEKTALAEAEIEYHDYQSDQIWAKFPVEELPAGGEANAAMAGAYVLIWTTTPWTIPGNRAICYSSKIEYGLYQIGEIDRENTRWARSGEKLIIADALAEEVMRHAHVTDFKRLCDIDSSHLAQLICAHPLAGAAGGGYRFKVPLFDGNHVNDDTGTGFVHTAPGHGSDDFAIWRDNRENLKKRGIDPAIPECVDESGCYTEDAPGFVGHTVVTARGKKGTANGAVIEALQEAGMLLAAGRLTHSYPHSWRSKKPIIFRNSPQWFIAMDVALAGDDKSLRMRALQSVQSTRFVPAGGQNRLRAMIEDRPDWVVSRQRVWGVPISIFVNRQSGEILDDPRVNDAIVAAFEQEGADAWFCEGAAERFLSPHYSPEDWQKIDDILDVWFESGASHAYCLETRDDLRPKAKIHGGEDYVLYLEGSDQHRGWFQSSLLESCATRGSVPFDAILTHGFTMAEDGRKMSKSLGNQTRPQDVIKQSGADILRLWVASVDYADDQRIGPEILKSTVEAYRKIRNTIRWMLGALAHYDGSQMGWREMPELERLMLHQLTQLDDAVRESYQSFDLRQIFTKLFNFMNSDLSAFFFDVRKDVLYCDPPSSKRRLACLQVLATILDAVTLWLAPILPFTCEDIWARRRPENGRSIHLEQFLSIEPGWRDDGLAEKWQKLKLLRRVVTGALEIERREKRIGSSLEAHPQLYIEDGGLFALAQGEDMAEIAITSGLTLHHAKPPHDAYILDDLSGVGVICQLAKGRKCARSWKISDDIGLDEEFPDVSARDAAALRELRGAGIGVD